MYENPVMPDAAKQLIITGRQAFDIVCHFRKSTGKKMFAAVDGADGGKREFGGVIGKMFEGYYGILLTVI